MNLIWYLGLRISVGVDQNADLVFFNLVSSIGL